MDIRTLSRYAFFAFLFLLPFQTVLLLREPFMGGEKWHYGTIGVYFSDALLLATICFFVIASRFWEKIKDARCKIMEKEPRDLSSLITYHASLILILLVGWALLSIFWAEDQTLAGYFVVKLLLGAGAFFLARSLDDTAVRTAIRILLAAAILQAAIATGQFLWQASPASTLLGMSAYESWQAGTSVLKPEGERWLRAYGSFPHPNMLGGFLAIVLVLSVSGYGRRVVDTGRFLSPIIHHLSPALVLLALILTFSRTAWLGAVIGIAAYYVIGYVTGSRRRPMSYRPLWVLGVAAVFVFVLRDQVFPRFDAATVEREGSVSERIVSLEDAKALITAHPFLGVGAGNFTAAIIENEPDRPVWSIQPAHDVFALVFAELGAVGLLLFVMFLTSVIFDFRFSIYEKKFWIPNLQSKIFNLKSSILLVLLPSLLLDHWLWSSHFGILFFFFLAGLAARK